MKEALINLGLKALITDDGHLVLMVGQRFENNELWYDLPGGRLDVGEKDFYVALKREIAEEIGVEVEVHELLSLSLSPSRSSRPQDVVLAVYHCSITKGQPEPQENDGVEEVKWVHIDEIPKMPFARYSADTIEEIKKRLKT